MKRSFFYIFLNLNMRLFTATNICDQKSVFKCLINNICFKKNHKHTFNPQFVLLRIQNTCFGLKIQNIQKKPTNLNSKIQRTSNDLWILERNRNFFLADANVCLLSDQELNEHCRYLSSEWTFHLLIHFEYTHSAVGFGWEQQQQQYSSVFSDSNAPNFPQSVCTEHSGPSIPTSVVERNV